MSIQAMAWAIEQQEVKDPGSRLVLICLCNWAGAEGQNAFPSIKTLCRNTGMSESTVRRHLRKLEKASIIKRGNQAFAAAQIARVDHRPTVYDIVTGRGVTMSPRELNGVSNRIERGVKKGLTGCQALTPDPKRTVREPKSGGYTEEGTARGLAMVRALKAKMTGAPILEPEPISENPEELGSW